MIRLLALLALASCSDVATAQPDASFTCSADADTEMNGSASYPCTTTDGAAGLCTTDKHGAYTCFPSCAAQFECPVGSSSYVLFLEGDVRVCYCMLDGLP